MALHKRSRKHAEERGSSEPLACSESDVLCLSYCDFQIEDSTEGKLLPFAVLPCGGDRSADLALIQASSDWSLHYCHCPEKHASFPPKSIINHGFLLRDSYWFAHLCPPFPSGSHFGGKLQLSLCSLLEPIRRAACVSLMYKERWRGWGSHTTHSAENVINR